jgi:hypothetical protein
MFNAETIDDLTVGQYNLLLDIWNQDMEEANPKKADKFTTQIVSIAGKEGKDYGDG